MAALVFDEQYGEVSADQQRAYRDNNTPPALHDELVDYFGDDHVALTRYVRLRGHGLNYGDVYREKPARSA